MFLHKNAWNVKWTRPTCSTQQKYIIHAPSFISFSSFARSTFASCLWLHIKYCVTSRIFISTCLILCSHKRNINKFYENITFHIRRQMYDICHATHVPLVNCSTSLRLRLYTSIALIRIRFMLSINLCVSTLCSSESLHFIYKHFINIGILEDFCKNLFSIIFIASFFFVSLFLNQIKYMKIERRICKESSTHIKSLQQSATFFYCLIHFGLIW